MRSLQSKSVGVWYAKKCVWGSAAILLVVLIVCAAAGNGIQATEPDQKGQSAQHLDYKELQRQAQQVRKEYPELFKHLVQRDAATTELVQAFVRAIPNPERLPKLRIPFMDAVIELMAPSDDCPICDHDGNSLSLLSEELRAKLCHICRTGIYLRGSGIGALGGR